MSLALGLFIILFIGIIVNSIIDWLLLGTDQDERIKQLDDHNDWQDRERERLRERIVDIEKRLKEMEERDK